MPKPERKPIRLALILAAVAGAALSAATISGCNTVKGAGQDLQDASDGVKDAITDGD